MIISRFKEKWNNPSMHVSEKSDTHSYWDDLKGVFGTVNIRYEMAVKTQAGDNGFIDAYIHDGSNVLIEQKGWGINLDKPEKRPTSSDPDRMVTPLQQAIDYNNALNADMKAQYIITSNFNEIRMYDLNAPVYGDRNADSMKPNWTITLDGIGSATLDAKAFESILHGISIMKKQELDSKKAAGALDILRTDIISAEENTNKHAYHNPHPNANNDNMKYMQFLSLLMLIFYMDDAGVFEENYVYNANNEGDYHLFRKLLGQGGVRNFKTVLKPLFTWLGTPEEKRTGLLESDEYGVYNDDITRFPYVNGIFSGDMDFPDIDEEMLQRIINCYQSYNWKNVNPTLFGSMMQGMFDDVEVTTSKNGKKTSKKLVATGKRRQDGIHWTPASYIHKAIDPLIINKLTDDVRNVINDDSTVDDLQRVHAELASYRFLDPACGSGNFLTETYLTLRELENEIIVELAKRGHDANNDDIIVNLSQFAGIEIQPECENIINMQSIIAIEQSLLSLHSMLAIAGLDSGRIRLLPVKDEHMNVVIGNSLRVDWKKVMPASAAGLQPVNVNNAINANMKDAMVIGNPPFIGQKFRSDAQTDEMKEILGKNYDGFMDYCACWYFKAADYIDDTHGSMTLISTSGIVKSSQATSIFKPLFEDYKLKISFAYQRSLWPKEAGDANVAVAVVSMKHAKDFKKDEKCLLFSSLNDADNVCISCDNINQYLVDANTVWIGRTNSPIGHLNEAKRGSDIVDDNNLIVNNDAYNDFMKDCIIKSHPDYLREYVVGDDIINAVNLPRHILWLHDSTAHERASSKLIADRIRRVNGYRKKSSAKTTRAAASSSYIPLNNHQPDGAYLAIPYVFKVREYMTCDYYDGSVIIGAPNMYVDDNDGYNFACIESSMMMAWIDIVGGQLGTGAKFVASQTWNNFPMPAINDDMRTRLINAGKKVYIARTDNPDMLADDDIANTTMPDLIELMRGERTSTLAELYTPGNIPSALQQAHDALDRIMDEIIIDYACNDDNAYKNLMKGNRTLTDADRLKYLFTAYERMISEKESVDK